ncbi:MAG: benzoate-CoA ligase family protein [Nocardiopsaceae bacterium]|nr:benzoate-CoA ligase family protein [Nocardiopsaceae bacterium]
MATELFNASTYLVDRQLEAGRGDHPAVTGPAGQLTYAELAERTGQLAAGLAALGVRPEERVMLVMTDRPETVLTFLALLRMGAVAVPVSTMYNGAELGELLRDCRARVVVATGECAAAVREAAGSAPEARTLILARPSGQDDPGQPGSGRPEPAAPAGTELRDWDEVLAEGRRAGAAAPYPAWFDSPGFWLYTSGTTGTPKAAMHRHGSIARVCETYASQVLGIRPDDRCYSVAKLFFAYGIGNSLFFPFSAGATTVLDPARATPAGAAARLAADRPTLFFASPAFFTALLNSGAPAAGFAPVRLATSAGEALPAEIYRRFTSRYGVDIIDGLGSTEALHIFISNRPGEVRPGTSGTVVPGYQARLEGEDGGPVPDGEPGSLLVRGDSIATGYWCRTAVTRQVFQGEWLRTGDTYTRSADGFYTCLGRSNDMIKAGGIWVSPMEVEARLIQHPSVAECAVVGSRDADGLEQVVACVVPAAGQQVDEEGLIAFCREALAAFKRPRSVLTVTALPKTATGKIQRVVVRDQVAAALGKEPSAGAAGGPAGDVTVGA